MSRVKAAVSHAREMQVLACVHEHATGLEGAVISITALARMTGLTSHQARAALQRLAHAGLLEVRSRRLLNGATAENSYFLTQAGFDALAEAPIPTTASTPLAPATPTTASTRTFPYQS